MWQDGPNPNVGTFVEAVHACEANHRWEVAIQLLEEMGHDGLAANSRIYELAASACEKGGGDERSITSLRIMASDRNAKRE